MCFMQVFNQLFREIHVHWLWKPQCHVKLLIDNILHEVDLEVELLNEWFPHANIHIEEVQG